MTQDLINRNHYIADKGKVIIQKGDVLDAETNTYATATQSLWLGKGDSIANYEEVNI